MKIKDNTMHEMQNARSASRSYSKKHFTTKDVSRDVVTPHLTFLQHAHDKRLSKSKKSLKIKSIGKDSAN